MVDEAATKEASLKKDETYKEDETDKVDSSQTVGTESTVEPVQTTIEIPTVNINKYEIPENDGLKFIADMKIGWNLGNTFDAIDDNQKDDLIYETMWNGVKTSKKMIDTLKEAGFNTIRIPVSWHNHVTGTDFTINKVWMDRVQEVVDYVIDNGMYAIINIHHDNSPEYFYPSTETFESSSHYLTSIWSQIAERYKEYDDHLIFESLNEPRLTETNYEWWLDMSQEQCREAVELINLANELFVKIVRATGGNNPTRYLMVPGYDASADYALIDEFRLPKDTNENNQNKIIVSVHAYTPYNFALQGPSEAGSISIFNEEDSNSTKDIDNFMDKIYHKYVSKGIPVLIGEFGARSKGDNLQDRVNFSTYYIAAARARGITACWWDNNAFIGNGENFGVLDRKTLTWKFPDIITGLMKYSE